jgi:hypothetical protein
VSWWQLVVGDNTDHRQKNVLKLTAMVRTRTKAGGYGFVYPDETYEDNLWIKVAQASLISSLY